MKGGRREKSRRRQGEKQTEAEGREGGKEDRERAILRTWFCIFVSLGWQTTLTGRK